MPDPINPFPDDFVELADMLDHVDVEEQTEVLEEIAADFIDRLKPSDTEVSEEIHKLVADYHHKREAMVLSASTLARTLVRIYRSAVDRGSVPKISVVRPTMN